MIREKRIIRRLEPVKISLKLLSLPAGSAILEPDSHLAGLQPQLACQLTLPLWLQLVFLLKAPLEHQYLYFIAATIHSLSADFNFIKFLVICYDVIFILEIFAIVQFQLGVQRI
jgi:hypothetical protein